MIKHFFLLFFLLMAISCSKSSYFVTSARSSERDNDIYINTDLHISVQQNQLSRIYPNFKPLKNNQVLNKFVKLHRLKTRYEILFYAEDFDKKKSGHLVEYYPKGLGRTKQYRKLKRRNFRKLSEEDGLLTYEKEVNGYEYFFGEKLEQLEKGTLRIINIERVGKYMIPNIWNENLSDFDRRVDSVAFSNQKLDQISENYRKALKQQIWSRQMILHHFDKLPEEKKFNEMGKHFFQRDLQFNYSRLNIVFNRAVKDAITVNDRESYYRAQTLLSYLSRNEDVYKLEKKKTKGVDSILFGGEIVQLEDLFLKIKEQDIRIVIINNDDYWTQCHYQARKMLQGFKKFGFNTVFSDEVDFSDTLINFGDQIGQGITLDPTFGNFLKECQKLDFAIYGFSDKEDRARTQIGNRVQVESIIKNINGKRAVVYCSSSFSKLLVEQMKNALVGNFLSIDQARLIGLEEKIANKFGLEMNTTYLMKSNMQNDSSLDYFLFEPNSSYFSNSPDYIYDLGDVKIDIVKYFTKDVFFLEIYSKHKRITSVPIFICSKENVRNNLRLFKGEYFMLMYDKVGQILKSERLDVK